MSKLDEAFLKAYAKDRGAATRIQPTILREQDLETASKIWIDSDDRAVVRRDEGVVDTASSIGQSATGRVRGMAASQGAAPPPSRPLVDAAPSVLVFDSAHAFQGPHYQPISLNLSGLDLFESTPLSDALAAPAEPAPASSATSDGDIQLSEPTARLAPDVPEPSPAVTFQAVWEVDRFEFEQTICELSGPTSPLREAGRRLRGACSEGLKILAIVSPLRGQGRSTLAISLSRMVAAAGARVVLVDGDLGRPALVDKLRLQVELGWDEAIRTGLPAEEVAVNSVEDGFTVLPLVAPQATDSPRPTSAATAAMLRQLSAAFDLVIIDTGNLDREQGWIPGAEPACLIDAALVVEDARGDDPVAQQACLQRLRQFGIENIGIVENFAG